MEFIAALRLMFTWAKSFLPPTGVIDAVAATIAVAITLAMLATANFMFVRGHELNEKDVLQSKFGELYQIARKLITETDVRDLRDRSFWQRKLTEILT